MVLYLYDDRTRTYKYVRMYVCTITRTIGS